MFVFVVDIVVDLVGSNELDRRQMINFASTAVAVPVVEGDSAQFDRCLDLPVALSLDFALEVVVLAHEPIEVGAVAVFVVAAEPCLLAAGIAVVRLDLVAVAPVVDHGLLMAEELGTAAAVADAAAADAAVDAAAVVVVAVVAENRIRLINLFCFYQSIVNGKSLNLKILQ